MDDDGGLGIRNWGYYEQPVKNNLGLQLMPAERDTKPLLSSPAFLHRDCGIAEPSMAGEFGRDGWDNMIPMMPGSHRSYDMLSDASGAGHPMQMIQQTDEPKYVKPLQTRVPHSKIKTQARAPKPKKPKKVAPPDDEVGNGHVSRGRSTRKNTESVVINGVDLDISGIPTPVCTCTGTPQPCYRWGFGGWQSACCTTNISMHPLPMSTKRRGSRIAGRKMSQGAFKKVLGKLAGEGYNLSNPIDLKCHWAKHGTNKFVTIR